MMTDAKDTICKQQSEMRESNLQWFAEQFPGMHQQLLSYEVLSTLEDEGDGWYNLDLSGQKLYSPSAKEFITNQLDAFEGAPFRIKMAPMQPSSFDRYASNCLHRVIERIDKAGIQMSQTIPATQSYYVIVFGAGLGAHLETLVEKTKCQALIVVEPNLEFLAQSLNVFDWQKLHDTMVERGGYLNVITSDSPDQIFMKIKNDIRLTNPCSMDGTILFTNYNNPLFPHMYQRLHSDIHLILSGLGFYFDETVMLANTHENLRSGTAKMVRFTRDKIKAYPVFIVASGPSLDKDMEWIKANQDKAIIIACGSAIMPLLRNEVQPDFTVEIENIPELHPMMVDTVKYVDVSKVHLLASTTIDPRVPKFFDQTSYYFRPALSCYPTFARPEDEPMENGSPTVTNAALALAQSFGFREFYLFGTDMGSKVQGLAHSKHAWQNSDEGCEVDIKFNIPVRGNFGGTVYSYQDMNWTRDELELAIRHFHKGRFYYNCSDGAYIKGTLAKHSRSVKLKDQPFKKAVEIKKIVDSFALYPKEDFAAHWRDEEIRNKMVEYCEGVIACFDDPDNVSSKRALTEANKALAAYHKKGLDLGLAMVFRGTLWQALIGTDYYVNRVVGKEDRAAAETIFKEEFVRLTRYLLAEATADLGHLSEHEWHPRDRQLEFEVENWDVEPKPSTEGESAG